MNREYWLFRLALLLIVVGAFCIHRAIGFITLGIMIAAYAFLVAFYKEYQKAKTKTPGRDKEGGAR